MGQGPPQSVHLHILLLLDPYVSSLVDRATTRQRQAHRPGTTANREATIKQYAKFSILAGFQYDAPLPHHVCWFMEHLADRGLESTTITNHLSSLRTYFGMAGLNNSPLYVRVVINAMRGISINIRHTPAPALLITPQAISTVLANAGQLQYPSHIRLAVVWMFMGFLRQSNLAPKTTATFNPTRHLTRGDVKMEPGELTITHKWLKTMQKSSTPTTITLWAKPGSSVCPVAAYQDLLRHAPTYHRDQPLLQYADYNPMMAPYIAKCWARLLDIAGLPRARYTLHGLRRGGASYSYHGAGATLEDVMSHGRWASSAVLSYLTPQRAQKTSVHRALASISE